MKGQQPLDLLLNQRKEHWLMHCRFVLDELLLPLCNEGCVKTTTHSQRAVVLIENRIDKQWLFTLLNTWLMCPKDSQFVLIADKNSTAEARELLNRYASGLNAIVWDATQIVPGVQLTEHNSFNAMLKRTEFWKQMPHENLLFIQTDALVAKPIHPFFFNFSYLGAPFLPRQHSEYFTVRDAEAKSTASSKPIRQSMGRPTATSAHTSMATADSQSFENGDGNDLQALGRIQLRQEAEDVFFSRHISKVSTPAPLDIAQAFSTETTYNPNAIGSHACCLWKALTWHITLNNIANPRRVNGT